MEPTTTEIVGPTPQQRPTNKDSRRIKRNCLILILAIMTIGGFLQGVFPENPEFPLMGFITSVLAVIMAIRWCLWDAEERNFTVSFRLTLLLFFLFPLAFLYYVLRTRRNREALKVMGIGVGVFLLAAFLNGIAYALGCTVYDHLTASMH